VPNDGALWIGGQVFRFADLIIGGTGYQRVQTAFSINDASQVLSTGFTGSAIDQILLNPVPEVDSSVVFAIGLAALTISRRRWRGKSNT
jgi:hypothetical protein